ncbi:MAG: hypothetical protein [Caudoviricetes sp.]|nr:MAG: hypothetical protein [Caudoviricetes sp.]
MQTFTSKQYLAIDIANNFGLDKKTWDERLEWFEENKGNLLNLVESADEPAMFYAGVVAYQDMLDGKPIGYTVALDATSSGLQLLSCLTGDRKAAELCNVVNYMGENGKPLRRDAYTVIYHTMLDIVGQSSRVKRDDCKQAVMTAFYGSEAKPKEVFGEGILLRTFENVMDTSAPGPWALNKFLLQCGNPDAMSYLWVLPDNFHCQIKVMVPEVQTVNFLNKPYDITRMVQGTEEKTRMLSANTTHSIDGMVVREMLRRCNYDADLITYVKQLCYGVNDYTVGLNENYDMVCQLWNHYKRSGFLSMYICNFLDADSINLVDRQVIHEMLETLPKKPFGVLTVHDCFRCHPNYGNDLRRQYNQILSDIAKSDLLGFILSQVLGQEFSAGKLDNDMWKDILEAEYALS